MDSLGKLRHGSVYTSFTFFFFLLSFFGLAPSAHGQNLYGSLLGTVTDPSGAAIPGATVEATNVGTGLVRTDSTDNGGRFNIANLQPGNYTVKVTAKGFKVAEKPNFALTAGQVSKLEFPLEVGQSTQSVTVSADAALLQTEKASTTSEISSKQISQMALGQYRNYESLINLVPGATPGTQVNSTTDAPERALATNINGGNAQTNITKVDGAESINAWLPNHVGYVAPAETIDVVTVTTSAGDADQGMAGSSAITVVTKSGTNEIHGSAFGFYNNQRFNARNYFLSSPQKPGSTYWNYGATLGGKIIKDKLFYFASFDGTNQKITYNGLYTVPTLAERNGDFSFTSTKIYDPSSSTLANGVGRTQFPNNQIPVSSISSIARAIQNFYPLPNRAGTANNYYAEEPSLVNRYFTDVKINYNRNAKHSIWGKYGTMRAQAGSHGVFGLAGGPVPDGNSSPGLGHTLTQVGSLGHTYTFSPNLILDGTVAYQRIRVAVNPDGFGTNFGLNLGIPGTNGSDILQSGFPYMNIANFSYLGVPSWMPERHTDETYSSSHNLTWNKGAHEIRFGFDINRIHLNHYQPELSSGGTRGYFDFNGQVTTVNGGSTNQFNSYAQFLLGASDDIQKGYQYVLMTGREWQFGWYVKDRWRITPKLTFNYGVRYELYPLMTRSNGKGIERYDPYTNQLYLGGRGNVPVDVGITVSHKLFAPKAGLAYQFNDKTVFRAGYGINYDPLAIVRPLRGFYPLTINFDTAASDSYSAAGSLATGIPQGTFPDLSSGVISLPGNVTERTPWGGQLHRGYIQSFNATVERKLPSNFILTAAFVGSASTHLFADHNINYGYPGSGTAALPYNTAAYGNRKIALSMWDGYLSSHYDSLQSSINRSFANGLIVKGAYTWSKAIDYTDDDGWASVGYNTPSQFQRNRAAAGFDRTHNLQMSFVYELPVGKGKQFVNNGIASQIVGGWQVSSNIAAYTGTPLTVTASATSVNDGGTNTQTANQVVANVQKIGAVGPGQYYYNPANWAAVTAVAYGNSGRNSIRGPGVFNMNTTLMRSFPVKDRLAMQFRAEFYNLTNTPIFANPTVSYTSGSFMQITSASGERNIRFSLRAQW